MFNSKYSKLLTVILIIVIIAIIILLVVLGFDVFKKHTIESASSDAVDRFEEQLNQMKEETNTQMENTTTNVIYNPSIDLSGDENENTSNNESSGSSGSSSNENTVMYEGYEVIGTIEIPATNIKYPIIKQDDVGINSLKVAICNLYGELNEPGSNAVLVGHNYRNGTFFSNNKKLQKGDKIYITDNSGNKVTYVIYRKYETSTGDFDYATRVIEGDKREISLSTCTDDSKKRLIIWAEEE